MKHPFRRRINVNLAIAMKKRFKTWTKVARYLRDEKGSRFQAHSIVTAIRRAKRNTL